MHIFRGEGGSSCEKDHILLPEYVLFPPPVLQAIREKKREVYALIAPAFLGQFGEKVTVGRLRAAFKAMGFKGMVEVAVFEMFSFSFKPHFRFCYSIPKNADIYIEIPQIQVMKSQQYTLEDIFEKNLLMLIPFYIFSHETRFGEYEKDKAKLRVLQEEYEQELLKRREYPFFFSHSMPYTMWMPAFSNSVSSSLGNSKIFPSVRGKIAAACGRKAGANREKARADCHQKAGVPVLF